MTDIVIDGMECEDVKIGDWSSRLPSELCYNQKIFDEIFSVETWNKILQPEQRDRILRLLPPEVSSSAEAANLTIEELLNGTLTAFSRNPLKGFFSKLEQGQYDPEVMDIKSNIMGEWKKESLRQLKSYHAKLLEDIVVSRQKYLNRIRGQSTGMSRRTKHSFKNCIPIRYESKDGQTSNQRNSNTLLDGRSINVASRKRNPTSQSSTDSLTEHSSAKLFKTSSDISIDVNSIHESDVELNKRQTLIQDLQPTLVPDPKSEELIHSSKPSLVYLLNQNESKTLPINQSFESTSSPSIDSLIPESVTSVRDNDGADCQTVNTIAYVFQNKVNDFPAPESQIRESAKDPMFENKSDTVDEPDSCRMTLNYYNKVEEKSSDDDLETSSDEFETIEPTIGFGLAATSPTVSIPAPTNENPKKIESVKIGQSLAGQTVLINNPGQITNYFNMISVKSVNQPSVTLGNANVRQVQPHSASNVTHLESRQNAFPHLKPNPEEPSPKVMSTQTIFQPLKKGQANNAVESSGIHLLSPIKHSELPIIEPQPNSSPDACTNGIITDCTPQSTVRLFRTNIQPQCMEGTSQLPVTISSTPKTINSPMYGISTESQELTETYLTKATPSFRLAIMQPSTAMPLPKNQAVTDTNVIYSHSPVHECEPPSTSNFGKNSSDLELNIDIPKTTDSRKNLNSSGLQSGVNVVDPESCVSMKMEIDVVEKIDDLSVLDGNPFDSIPNLSDELDGLDLDLVDGLCDFEILLSDEKKYPSFFCLIRDVLCSTKDHRMNLVCMEKTINKWCSSTGASLNSWFLRVSNWNTALVTALNFLVGSYQDVHPEDFVPYIEYKYKTKYYQWIGAGRDSDSNLTSLCSVWMDNLDRLPSIKKVDGETEDQDEDDEENEDSELTGEDSKKKNKRPQTPPPPRFVTDWSVRQSTEEEKILFRKQERSRFENPHKAFTYKMHGYESVVGPVKGVYSSQVGMTNKARGHSLLVDDRPPYVTILALVRDAVARLPNGEGTRSDICEMLRDSAFLAPDASNVTLNSVVSGALDRLHYERDPCVRYDSHKKSWIYLHRDRTQDQFERLHHNRSYTKSTKCRNSGSRKPRKGISKSISSQSTVVPSVTSGASVSTSSASIIDSEGSLAEFHSTSTKTPGTTTVPKPVNVNAVTKTEVMSCGPTEDGKINNEASVIEDFGTRTSGDVNSTKLTSNELPSDLSSNTTLSFSNSFVAPCHKSRQLILQTTDIPPQSLYSQNSVQIRTIRPITIQNTTSHSGIYSSNQTLTTNSTPNTLPHGQFLLGPSTMLRLANTLRMSQFRIQGTNTGQSGTVRIPQHRILLTRGSVPIQSQTQGVLLGQTSCGQTVILSTTGSGAISGLQTIGSISARPHIDVSHRGVYNATPITIPSSDAPPTTALPCLSSSGPTAFVEHTSFTKSVGTLPSKVTESRTPFSIATSSCLKDSASSLPKLELNRLGLSSNTLPSSNNSTSIPVPAEHVTLQPTSTTSTTLPISCSVVQRAQTQDFHNLYDTNSDTANGMSSNSVPQTPMTSPIIIRSTQGEFVIPGHISLSRGVQGIKLVPLPLGSKTVLAKIIPSNSTPTPGSLVFNAEVNSESSGPESTLTSKLSLP